MGCDPTGIPDHNTQQKEFTIIIEIKARTRVVNLLGYRVNTYSISFRYMKMSYVKLKALSEMRF